VTPGTDPSQEWAEVAAAVVGPGRFAQLAMGGGQTQEALALLRHAAANGEWAGPRRQEDCVCARVNLRAWVCVICPPLSPL